MKIAVSGGKGRLGSELVAMGCDELVSDITKEEEIKEEVLYLSPDVVINCAAYTDVDGAESKEGLENALKVNVRGVEYLRRACMNCTFIHISTDYVFNGKSGAYNEKYKKYAPLSAYGASKLGGEVLFLTEQKMNDVLVRTTGLYGGSSGKHDFTKLVIGSLSAGKSLEITKELRGNQTYVPHFAEALLYLAQGNLNPPIINIGSKEVISRYDFALMIAGIFDLDKSLITPCKNSDIASWVAERPKKGGVKTHLAKKLKVPIYTILEGLQDLKERYDTN